MEYPNIKIDGKPIELDKKLFDFIYKTIKKSLAWDNEQNILRLTEKDMEILAWNAATMLFLGISEGGKYMTSKGH